MFDSVFDMKSK